MRRDVQENDEEAVRVKEQSILELGTLLAKTGQAAGNVKSLKGFHEVAVSHHFILVHMPISVLQLSLKIM